LLGYNKWERFDVAIQKAIIACQQTGNIVEDHFPGGWKVITAGKGAKQDEQPLLLDDSAE
jgi:DNA-damage-inducible protein D